MTTAELIERHEGRRLKPYQCPGGRVTIGVGRNLDDKGITDVEADILRDNDIAEATSDLLAVFGVAFGNFSRARQAALTSMRFQLGPGGFRSFVRMIEAIRMGAWPRAETEALDSDWHRQTPQRAEEIGRMLATGQWPDDG